MSHKHDENDVEVCENCGGEIHPEVTSVEKNFGNIDANVEVYEKNHIVLQSVASQYGHTAFYDDESCEFFGGDHPIEQLTLSFNEETTRELIASLQAALAESEKGEPVIHAVPPPIGERN